MKKLNKLSLSLVVGSLLFTQSYALPSGGKFTHGTSGSISSSNGIMNITGNKQNSVIQWGGGFNIANGETVNFKGNGYNYLNIVYGSKSSHIDGKLEGGTNNIFLINPNGIVVGKDGSINANRVFLSASSIGDKEMQEFASSGKISAFDGDPRTISPVIKSNAGNVINLGTISVYDRVVMAGNQVSNIKYGSTDYGKFIFTKEGDARDIYLDVYTFNILVLAGAAKDIFKVSNSIRTPNIRPSKGITGPADSLVGIDKGYKETSDLITKDDIFTIYTDSELKNKLSEDILQSIDFMAALYGQASTNENAKLKEALSTSYENVEKAGKSINTVKNTLSQIAKTTEEQKNTQKAYDDALNNYNTIVELYNKALKIGDSKVLETLKTEMNSKYIVLQQATTALKDATSSNNSNLETNKQTIASASIDNYK
ncbi:filamentous hemagglutinin N-terminal domain-containing protein, partial [Campylobacter jejuni]|nr:filamentous hemagglutinin N-terminal domain-containing protein [Campylobacter jejuni]